MVNGLNKFQKKLLDELLKKEKNRRIQRARMVSAYEFEHKVKKRYEKKGYIVFRTSGSKPVDLIAINPETHEIILIECKSNGHYSKDQMERQVDLAKKLKAKLVLAIKKKRTKYVKIYEPQKELRRL